MSTSKKLKSEQLFVRVETVMHDLQISRPFAYRMIAGWNEELKEQGYTTICGRIPKAYYEKKIYGIFTDVRNAYRSNFRQRYDGTC